MYSFTTSGCLRNRGSNLSCSLPVASKNGIRDSSNIRSEEHTSELQSHSDLVCRLLLEKKKYCKGSMVIHTRTGKRFDKQYLVSSHSFYNLKRSDICVR